MLWVLLIWSVAIVAFVAGVALCVYGRIRVVEERIRIPLEQQIKQQQEKLQKIKSARAARDLFLASLSHELRTPLSGIQGAVQLLRNTGLKGTQQEYTDMIAYASASVLEIVDDMLTYSRMQTGSIQLESVAFNVRQMLDDMLSLQSIKVQDKGIVLISDVAPDVPARLVGDRGKLNQILLNLIGNAIKFTHEGSVTVSVECVPQADPDDGVVLLSFEIRDTGIGMTDDELDQMFEPFVQGHAARHGGRQGTGLGLTICQRLLGVLGGRIQIESVLNEGTTVSVQLPLAAADSASELQPDMGLAQSSERSLVVLVVEDDDINRLVCTRYLALAGHHPVAVADERQVQHVMAFSACVPDVVLMDVNLAGYSGIELAQRMGAVDDARWREVPVIAMSADNSGNAHEQARAGGISVFLAKPFSASRLYEALDTATSVQTSSSPAPELGSEGGETALPTASAGGLGTSPQVSQDDLAEARTPPDLSGVRLLDENWLSEEVTVLGGAVMLELLNLFRSSAAKTFKALHDALDRADWRAAADLLHTLQGSSANLGMRHLAEQLRGLQANILVEDGPHPAYLNEQVTRLEAACHASADSLRSWLLSRKDEGVAFATQGDD